jgi:hypothetical protein
MTSRIVRVGRREQVVTTRWVAGKHPGFTDVHEHVTLATPNVTDSQRLRLLSTRDTGIVWPT